MKVRQKPVVTTIIGVCLCMGAVMVWIVRGRQINQEIDEFDRIMHEWKEINFKEISIEKEVVKGRK